MWLGLVGVGVIVLLVSFSTYHSISVQDEFILPTDNHGVIAFAAQDLKGAWLHLIIDNIDLERRAAKIQIDFEGLPEPFGFQFPFTISNFPNECREIPDVGSTYLWCFKRPATLNLTWTGIVQRRTFSTYALVIPFSTGSDIDPEQSNMLRTKLSTPTINFGLIESNNYSLSIVLPDGSSMRIVEPTPDHFARATNELRFYWDISDYFRQGVRQLIVAEPTVYLEFSSDQKQETMESNLFWSGIGFGVSIPLIVSGFAELVKDNRALEEIIRQFKKEFLNGI